LTEQVNMHGLHQKTIDALHTVLEKEDGVEAAVLYGSRAMGTYRNGSDIDLTLLGATLDLTTLQRIENNLDDLMLPYKIDLSLFKDIQNTELLAHIERVGWVLYQRKAAD